MNGLSQCHRKATSQTVVAGHLLLYFGVWLPILLKASHAFAAFVRPKSGDSAERFQLLSAPGAMKSVITYCHNARTGYDRGVQAVFREIVK